MPGSSARVVANLQRPLAPVGQLASAVVGEFAEPDILDIAARIVIELRQHPFRAPEIETLAALALQCNAPHSQETVRSENTAEIWKEAAPCPSWAMVGGRQAGDVAAPDR